MPVPHNLIDALRRLAVATLAYAVAVALVAGSLLPTLLSAQPGARSPQAAPPTLPRGVL